MNYEACLNYINSLMVYAKSGGDVGLKKIRYLCELFNNPQEDFKSIHVAGTNGKGSAVAMLSNIMSEAGHKNGRFISPYIHEFTERISIDNIDISRDDIVLYTNKIKTTLEEANVPNDYMPNPFQFITIMAFLYYKAQKCELAVLETGLGGRLDPTNIVKSPLVSVIMQIGMDHMDVLGNTIEQIAREKCGIIKENSAIVLYPLNHLSVMEIAKETAQEKNCEFIMPNLEELKILEENISHTIFEYKSKIYKLGLIGKHQVYNAVTVIEAADYLYNSAKTQSSYDFIQVALKKTKFPSRFEVISSKPLLIFDGAHNLPGIFALRETIKNLLPDKKIILVCGMLKDKDPETLIKNIAGEDFVERFIAVPVDNPRAEAPENLCKIAAKYNTAAILEASSSVSDGLTQALKLCEAAGGNLAIIAFGSLYLANEIRCAYEKL